ncbi:MAG: glycosyltransferase, partial [Bacteroidales bacterium]
MHKISVVIIAYNEESRIRQTLESVKWCDEIIVIDSCS